MDLGINAVVLYEMSCAVRTGYIYSQVLHMKKSVQGSNREAINTPV